MFYSGFFLLPLLYNILTVLILVKYYKGHSIHVFSYFIWIKLLMDFFLVRQINKKKKDEFYFYKNLGLNKIQLFAYSFGFDFLLYLISIIVVLNFYCF